jgi:hypothetical protein
MKGRLRNKGEDGKTQMDNKEEPQTAREIHGALQSIFFDCCVVHHHFLHRSEGTGDILVDFQSSSSPRTTLSVV